MIKKVWLDLEGEFEKYFDKINIVFKEYTNHNRQHLESLEEILDWLVPEEAWDEFNDSELFVLIKSIESMTCLEAF